MKVNKEIKLFPVGKYQPLTLSAVECESWDEANKVLATEYKKIREYLSEADRQRWDSIILN